MNTNFLSVKLCLNSINFWILHVRILFFPWQIQVHEAKEVETKQWDFESDEEEDKDDESGESEWDEEEESD